MSLDLTGLVRRWFPQWGNGTPRPVRLTALESLAIAEVEPRNLEASRAGARFVGGLQVIANAVASVQVIPTTSPTTTLYNADPAKAYALDWVTFVLASGTAPVGASLYAAVSPTKIATAPTANVTNWVTSSASGSVNASKALWAASVTMPGVPAYFPVALSQDTASTTVGIGSSGTMLDGSIIIPPGYGLGLDIVGGAGTTAKFGIYASWVEIQLDLQ